MIRVAPVRTPRRTTLPKRSRVTGLGPALLFAALAACPGLLSGQTPASSPTALPDGPIDFEFEAYANNVRVVPPLVAEFQLGVSRLSGRGTIRDGRVTGSFRDTDRLRLGTRSLDARIVDGTYREIGSTRLLSLRVEITASSHPSDECAPGLTGLLEIQDSPDSLPGNGQPNDFVRLGSWSGDCRTHVHGWNNTDGGPRTAPESGGPPGGGQWAVVEVEGGGTGRIATLDDADRGLAGAAGGGPLDLIIAFDLTSSMGSSIESMKAKTVDLVRRAGARSADFRLGLVTYRDAADADPFWERGLGPVSAAELEGLMADWEPRGGGDVPEDVAEALSRAIAMWEREGTTARKPVKLVVVVTDAPGKWPDGFGNTKESIARRALAVDPAHVYPIVVGGSAAALEDARQIAARTGGRLLRADEGVDVADAVLAAVDEGVARHAGEAAVGGGGGGGPVAGRGGPRLLYVLLGALVLLAAVAGATLAAVRRRPAAPAVRRPVELALEIVGVDGVATRVDVFEAPAVLGRDPGCDVTIDHPTVSRRHAELRVEDDELVLVDLGSTGGILADGVAVSRARLWSGRELVLGDVGLRVL